MTRPIDRRAFLTGALGLGVGAVAWACARGGEDDPAAETPSTNGANAISIIATAQGLALGDTRQAIAILRGQKPIAPSTVKVTLTPAGGEAFAVDAYRQEVLLGPGGDDGHDHEHPEGTEVTHIYSFRHDFDRPGIWEIGVEFEDEGGGEGVAQFQVAEKSAAPAVGDKAIASKSPTTDDPDGVDPICTRDPECSMHDMTIAQALDAAKPSVLIFATPRFCSSRTCGPVVDFVESAKEKFGDEVSFVHIEVWKDDEDSVNKPGGEAPAFAEWKLGTEPWIYFVDSKGVVADRWIGAVSSDEVETAVDALIS